MALPFRGCGRRTYQLIYIIIRQGSTKKVEGKEELSGQFKIKKEDQ